MEPMSGKLADAHAPMRDAAFVVIGVPYDATSSYRSGAKDGPAAIRRASYNFELWLLELGIDIEDIPFHDWGDIGEVFSPDALVDAVAEAVREVASKRGRVPILIGGEHNATEGAVRALHEVHPDIRVISLDAHTDFRKEYLDEPRSHACAMRRVSDIVGVGRVAVAGVRSSSREEQEDASELGYAFFTADAVRERGLDAVVDDLLARTGKGPLYFTLDLDVIDPSSAPGVQTPEPWGLTPLDIRRVIDRLAPHVVGMDIMECAPAHDGGQTALLAARLLRHSIGAMWQSRRTRPAKGKR